MQLPVAESRQHAHIDDFFVNAPRRSRRRQDTRRHATVNQRFPIRNLEILGQEPLDGLGTVGIETFEHRESGFVVEQIRLCLVVQTVEHQ